MATFHETKYMRYYILSPQNLTCKIDNAAHKKFPPATLHISEIIYPENITTDRH